MSRGGRWPRWWRGALAGTLVLGLMVTARAQSVTGPNPEEDPNFPGLSGKVTIASMGGDVTWTRHSGIVLDLHQMGSPAFAGNIPAVMLPRLPDGRPPGSADYLGFIEGEGSLLTFGLKGPVYVFNGSARTLTKKYESADDIPPDVLATLKNRKYLYVSSRDALNVDENALKEANNTHAPAAPKPYEPDPNLPEMVQDGSLPLRWNNGGIDLWIKMPQAPEIPALYLGFNDQDTWLANGAGTVYVWNLGSKTLTKRADSWWDAPMDLRNPSGVLQGVIYYRQHVHRPTAVRGPAPDPNLPPIMSVFSREFLAMVWQFEGNDVSRPLVFLNAGSPDFYLGFDERGTWVQNQYGGVYVWNYKTWKLALVARNKYSVPKAALARLHRPDGILTETASGQ